MNAGIRERRNDMQQIVVSFRHRIGSKYFFMKHNVDLALHIELDLVHHVDVWKLWFCFVHHSCCVAHVTY